MSKDNRTFVRQSFYVQPPKSNASAEEWEDWMEKDNMAARTAKAKFTRAANKAKDFDALPDFHTAKVNGRYKQVIAVGFVGQGEDGGSMEPIQSAQQELTIDEARKMILHKSGGTRKNRNKANRAKIRQARKAKYRNRNGEG